VVGCWAGQASKSWASGLLDPRPRRGTARPGHEFTSSPRVEPGSSGRVTCHAPLQNTHTARTIFPTSNSNFNRFKPWRCLFFFFYIQTALKHFVQKFANCYFRIDWIFDLGNDEVTFYLKHAVHVLRKDFRRVKKTKKKTKKTRVFERRRDSLKWI